jgi:hypothetical protein
MSATRPDEAEEGAPAPAPLEPDHAEPVDPDPGIE